MNIIILSCKVRYHGLPVYQHWISNSSDLWIFERGNKALEDSDWIWSSLPKNTTFFFALIDGSDLKSEIQRRRDDCKEFHVTSLWAWNPFTFLNKDSIDTRANRRCKSWWLFMIFSLLSVIILITGIETVANPKLIMQSSVHFKTGTKLRGDWSANVRPPKLSCTFHIVMGNAKSTISYQHHLHIFCQSFD